MEAGLLAGLTVREAYTQWLAMARQRLDPDTLRIACRNYRVHIDPAFGGAHISDISRRDVARWHLQCASKLSSRTAHNVLRLLQQILENASFEADAAWPNPADIPKSRRVPKRPSTLHLNREQYFTPEEAMALMTHGTVPEDRQVFYVISFLTGARPSETAALCWGDWDPAIQPLGRIRIHATLDGAGQLKPQTKTRAHRLVPTHPYLQERLQRWSEYGYERLFGVPPKTWIAPFRNRALSIVARPYRRALDWFRRDLERLGLRGNRTPHAMRHTFLTWAEAGGARREVLRRITHAGRADVVDGYIQTRWADLCAEVSRIKLPGDS